MIWSTLLVWTIQNLLNRTRQIERQYIKLFCKTAYWVEWLLLKREDPGSNPFIEILIKQLLYFQIEMIKIKKKFARMVGLFQNYNCHVIQIKSFTSTFNDKKLFPCSVTKIKSSPSFYKSCLESSNCRLLLKMKFKKYPKK